VGARTGDDADLTTGDRPGAADLGQGRAALVPTGRHRGLERRHTQTLGDAGAQSPVDVRQGSELTLPDDALPAPGELEGVRPDDMVLLDSGQ
jgi:hypothetical protein